jgi:death on curing protein
MKKPSESLPRPNWITPDAFEYICFNVAKEFMEYSEPIPDYSTRDSALLESSLAAPRQAYALTYASLNEQAFILFYSLIKNHPFRNGNKRIAVIALLIFLSLNGKWLDIMPKTLYKVAILVAESNAREREIVINTLRETLSEYIVAIGK